MNVFMEAVRARGEFSKLRVSIFHYDRDDFFIIFLPLNMLICSLILLQKVWYGLHACVESY